MDNTLGRLRLIFVIALGLLHYNVEANTVLANEVDRLIDAISNLFQEVSAR